MKNFIYFTLLSSVSTAVISQEQDYTEVLVTTATRYQTLYSELTTNTDIIDKNLIEAVNPEHLSELLSASSGTWLSRGNGQESLLSVRSPVLTGAGSCAEFLTLQDGIPLRASGFCNVNQLFDSHFEQAGHIEVVKGVKSAQYGSNAIHGLVNIFSPSYQKSQQVSVEYGKNDFRRLQASTADTLKDKNQAYNIALSVSKNGGYQDDSGYEQQKLSAGYKFDQGDWEIDNKFTLTHLNQDTAGYLQRGEEAYKDKSLLKINDFPDAYRNAFSARFLSNIRYTTQDDFWQITPYLRTNHMDFLMHFLPGTPVEENGHDSAGIQVQYQKNILSNIHLTVGVDVDATQGYLSQTQFDPTDTDSGFLNEVLPQGKQYDYDVDSLAKAIWSDIHVEVNESIALTAALRYDHIRYQYTNNMIDGNTREDGSECGFGGCRYTRPANRDDTFTDWSYSVGSRYKVNSNNVVYTSYDKGFRAPHTSELYRLQNGQDIADIVGVTAEQIELGYRYTDNTGFAEINTFSLNKRDGIFQDSDRNYLNGLDTRHYGVEASLKRELTQAFYIAANASWSQHKYDNNPQNSNGELTLIKDNSIDTAPEVLGNINLNWQALPQFNLNAQWQYVDEYYLNPENTEKYAGHDITNLRASYALSPQWQVNLRINNVFDQRYAERADYAFGNHRYFIGLPRSVYLQVSYDAF